MLPNKQSKKTTSQPTSAEKAPKKVRIMENAEGSSISDATVLMQMLNNNTAPSTAFAVPMPLQMTSAQAPSLTTTTTTMPMYVPPFPVFKPMPFGLQTMQPPFHSQIKMPIPASAAPALVSVPLPRVPAPAPLAFSSSSSAAAARTTTTTPAAAAARTTTTTTKPPRRTEGGAGEPGLESRIKEDEAALSEMKARLLSGLRKKF